MDRLSRNELHQALITEMLREHDVKIITPAKTYDSNKENDILLGDFEKLIARQELRLTKARLRRGKASAFEKGVWVNGFPPIPYLYNKETKQLSIDPKKIIEYNRIKDLALKGYSCNIIADRVGTNATKIKRTLKSKVGLGYTKYKGEYKKGLHEPVMTQEEYDIINNYLLGRISGTRKTKHHYPFSDILRCTCGDKRSAAKFNGKEAYLKCRYCKDLGSLVNNFHKEIRRIIKRHTKEIEKYFNSNEANVQKSGLEEEFQYVLQDIARENKKLENIKKMMINAIIDFDKGTKKMRKAKKAIEVLREREKLIIADMKNLIVDKKEDIISLKQVDEVLRNKLEDEEINMLYKTIINYIVVEDKSIVKIVWK